MRCEIVGDKLIILPDNHTEIYAINKWLSEHPIEEISVDPFQTDDI